MRNIVTLLRQKIASRGRQGKAFETMIRAALKRLSDDHANALWFMRLWDYRSFIKLNPKFFAFKQPADFLACADGLFYLIECKSSQANRYDPNNVRPHQKQAMIDVSDANGKYWLLVLHRKEDGDHDLFAFDRHSYLHMLAMKPKGGFATYSWEEVKANATRTLERKGGVWDLRPLFWRR